MTLVIPGPFGDDVAVLLSTLEPQVRAALEPDVSSEPSGAITHLLWFADGLLTFFLVSWVCTTMLRVDNDFYYAVFIWVSLTFVYKYAHHTNTNVLGAITTRWRSSLFLGGLTAIYVVVNVWNANPTERPGGALLAFELFWRGLAYGSVDSLVLTAFPMAVAYGVVGGNLKGAVRRTAFAALALMLIWTMSVTYHMGFEQFDDDLVTPQLTTTAVSLPAIITANPIGSVLAQTGLHVVATYRTFESDVFAPPEVEFIPDYEPPGIFGPR